MNKTYYTIALLFVLFILFYSEKCKKIVNSLSQIIHLTQLPSASSNKEIKPSRKLQKNEIVSTEGKTIFVDTL